LHGWYRFPLFPTDLPANSTGSDGFVMGEPMSFPFLLCCLAAFAGYFSSLFRTHTGKASFTFGHRILLEQMKET
jgi:hypothetical protein